MNSKQKRNRKRFQKAFMFNVSQLFRETAIRIEQSDLTPEEVVEELIETADELEILFREY